MAFGGGGVKSISGSDRSGKCGVSCDFGFRGEVARTPAADRAMPTGRHLTSNGVLRVLAVVMVMFVFWPPRGCALQFHERDSQYVFLAQGGPDDVVAPTKHVKPWQFYKLISVWCHNCDDQLQQLRASAGIHAVHQRSISMSIERGGDDEGYNPSNFGGEGDYDVSKQPNYATFGDMDEILSFAF